MAGKTEKVRVDPCKIVLYTVLRDCDFNAGANRWRRSLMLRNKQNGYFCVLASVG